MSELVDAVRAEQNTELSRLGSSKSLYADTDGEMEPDAVLAAMADLTVHAAETLADWGFADAAQRERDHYDAIVDELGDHELGDEPAVVAAMGEHAADDARRGAVVGYSLVAEQKASQATGFFTGQADPQTASLFRGFGEDYEAIREATVAAVSDADAAEAAAVAVVQAAYDDYFETLEDLGVNPKPVC